MPFIRRSTLRTLQARVETYAQAARDARRVEQSALANCRRLAEQAAAPDETLAQLREARAQLAAETRRADRLQDRLDDACGITTPAVDAGAMWQQNRTDKTHGVKP
ncbi:hypothetical protein [Streptomyces sp. rh34]|uniref:hypothetical protein n=1 Tax=Streptomyces sp. rh34 TaxID=2034272 RepID=UPI000BF0327B|nr:hypothetical protein [Streptomyces sp. rh34]